MSKWNYTTMEGVLYIGDIKLCPDALNPTTGLNLPAVDVSANAIELRVDMLRFANKAYREYLLFAINPSDELKREVNTILHCPHLNIVEQTDPSPPDNDTLYYVCTACGLKATENELDEVK